eukprot:PLAT9014.2.p1 GENE.PLAT9014.2~~PLAT9014.2.p1  ORF type:complete len:584 (+),score=223.37 PLAT9014.2:330-2081(+)
MPDLERDISGLSAASLYRAESYESYVYEGDSDDDGLLSEDGVEGNTAYLLDSAEFTALYGADKLSTTRRGATLLTVSLTLPVAFVPRSALVAWGVDPVLPIIIDVTFSHHYLDSTSPPKVAVYQLQGEPCGLSCQLSSIARTFIASYWRRREEMQQARFAGEADAMAPVVAIPVEGEVVAVGEEAGSSEAKAECDAGGDAGDPAAAASSLPLLSGGASAAQKAAAAAMAARSGFGLLVQVYTYCKARLPTVNEFCVICDNCHIFQSMLKPVVCARKLCLWSFTEMGVMHDAAAGSAAGAEVIDLLVSLTHLAVASARWELILTPFPTLFLPGDPSQPAVSRERTSIEDVRRIMKHIPSVGAMVEAPDMAKLRDSMTAEHPLSFAMLEWILSSNRCHIVKLEEEHCLELMATSFQYIVASAPPEKERRFQQLKDEHGSKWAFHGSPNENWHSILRNGLRNASGTKLQMHGAVHGAGVYLASSTRTSARYSKRSVAMGDGAAAADPLHRNAFLRGHNLALIAICEVIDIKHKVSGDIWVLPAPEYVITRFLCAYPEARHAIPTSLKSTDADFVAQAERARTAVGL